MPGKISRKLYISKKALDLLIYFEISTEANYKKKLIRPVYPGQQSGITWGFGFDAGYNSKAEIVKAWQGHVNAETLAAMISVAGLKGARAKAALASVQNKISITFEVAKVVFNRSTLPKYAKELVAAYPNVVNLYPDATGGMLLLTYNRGTAKKGARRREMLALEKPVQLADYQGIAAQIRSMVRLWDGKPEDGVGVEDRVNGLITRRLQEADLIEKAKPNLTGAAMVDIEI